MSIHETARALADDLRRWTERMNESLRGVERAMADKKFPPLSTVVETNDDQHGHPAHTRSNVLGWDGRRLTWNGAPLLSASRSARIAACEYLDELVEKDMR